MSNEKMIAEISKKLDTKLEYSEGIPNKKTVKPNVQRLKALSKSFRNSLEDDTVEVATRTGSSKSPQ